MMMMLAIAVFGATLGVASYAIAGTVGPNVDKIRLALAGRSPLAMMPAVMPVRGTHRLPVRRRAASAPLRPAAPRIAQLRAAA
ncbi:MAG: hypothetical protein J0I25_01455 [Sphingomonadales bacterium]|nr:hypothetical protein [Sphingomonadales bacterium]